MSIAVKSGLPSLGSTEGAVITKDDISVTEETSPSASVGEDLPQGKSAYEIAKENGFNGTETEWLASLKGEPGAPGASGKDGEDGKTPYVGDNGNWYIGADDTGKPSRGAKGDKGDTGAQGIQGEQGIQGVQGEKGEKGDTGAQGPQGLQGPQGAAGADGKTPNITIGNVETLEAGQNATASMGGTAESPVLNLGIPRGTKGEPGLNGVTPTFSIESVETGEPGTDAEVTMTGDAPNHGLKFVIPRGDKGDKGDPGSPGAKGDKGEPGAKGEPGSPGAKGADGKSAYQYAQDGGYTGTETEFTAKLAQEQLIGTTNDITPTQVYEAVSAGIPVKVQHIDSTYGIVSFTAFVVAESLNVIASNMIAYYNSVYMLCELFGDKSSNAWGFNITTLAQKTDIPDIPTALPNPNALTVTSGSNSVTYDGSTAESINIPAGPKGDKGEKGDRGDPGSDANVTAANVAAAMGLSGLAADDQIMVSAVDTNGKPTSWKKKWKDVFNIRDLGAKGDGVTDDTAVFQTALTNYRRVFVPGGVYVLSDEITIGDACELELSADTVFDFQQLNGNCISMKMSACLRGNHAVLQVPYAFAGNVINIASSLDASVTSVPPYTKWSPQWKTGRYVTDVCITKPDSRGFHYSVDGTCSGTAIYIEADSSATSTFIWGLSASGIRIAGAFAYGIHAKMVGTGWCHEARIEAFIDACEIGVCLEDCNNTYVSATIQPRAALTASGTNVAYAKYGIELIRSRNTDLSGSRVWDWNSANSLWTGDTDSGCVYQHIAMIGNCSGTILNDFFYYEMPTYDIRKLIYTDTASNLEKINILQEPFTRWFKPIGGAPMFYTGAENKELLLKEDYNSTFQTVLVPRFTNRLPTATATDGSIFGGKGYQVGKMWGMDGVTLSDEQGILCTGFIPCSAGAVVRLKGISFTPGDNNCRVILYKSDHSKLMFVNRSNLITNNSSYFINGYEETENGCQFTVVNAEAAYFKFNVYKSTSDGNPIVTVNEALDYEQIGTLASGIKVDYSQIINAPDFLTIGDLPRYDGSVS